MQFLKQVTGCKQRYAAIDFVAGLLQVDAFFNFTT